MTTLTAQSQPIAAADWVAAFDTIPFPIYVTDVDRYEIVEVNRAMRNKTGAAAGQPCYKAIFGREQPCTFCSINRLIVQETEKAASAVNEHFSDDDDCWYQSMSALGTWIDGRRVQTTIVVDVTPLRNAQAELAEAHAEMALKNRELQDIAITDGLTCLANRRHLDEIIASEADRSRRYGDPLSVIMIDIDHFKSVNDRFGHQIGDRALVELAALLRRGSRTIDSLGRWGGEEFLIVCPNTNLAGATAMAENLRQQLEAHTIPAIGRMTGSFGVAQLTGGETVSRLVDAALYRAKDAGRNRVKIDE